MRHHCGCVQGTLSMAEQASSTDQRCTAPAICELCGYRGTERAPDAKAIASMRTLRSMQPVFAEIGRHLSHDFKNQLTAMHALAGMQSI